MAPFVALPAVIPHCLALREPLHSTADHFRHRAPAASANSHWEARPSYSRLSRSHASTIPAEKTTSIAGAPHRRHQLSRQRPSEDCALNDRGQTLAHSASSFFGGLHEKRVERHAGHTPGARTSVRGASPRASFSSGRGEASSGKHRHARDAPVTFGGWYRDALADKRPPPLLGSLRPKQLQWMIRNFEETEFSDWAEMAAEVLKDPVYQDRVEWTEYERRLEKEGAEAALRYALSKGWVNRLDANAWDGVDPERIGTSLSRRIPRVGQEMPKATSVADRTLQLGALAAPPQGSSRTRSRQKDAPRRRRTVVVSSADQLQRRKERRMRQAERREESEGATAAGGTRQASGVIRDDSVTPVVPAGKRPGGEAGEGVKKGDSEWMPRTSSRDWLIQLVEKQEEAIEKEKKERKQ